MATNFFLKFQKKVVISLMACHLPPPPLNGPVIKKKTFFAAFLSGLKKFLCAVSYLAPCTLMLTFSPSLRQSAYCGTMFAKDSMIFMATRLTIINYLLSPPPSTTVHTINAKQCYWFPFITISNRIRHLFFLYRFYIHNR